MDLSLKDGNITITIPDLAPFQPTFTCACPKCGFTNLPRLMLIQTVLCLGQMPPAVDVEVNGQKHSVDAVCTGIDREHLHKFCRHCGFAWFTDVAPLPPPAPKPGFPMSILYQLSNRK